MRGVPKQGNHCWQKHILDQTFDVIMICEGKYASQEVAVWYQAEQKCDT